MNQIRKYGTFNDARTSVFRSVGGNLLGFVGGCQSPDSNRMLGIGYGGSFHLWCRTADNRSEQGDASFHFAQINFNPILSNLIQFNLI
jgi:hypothetical protein